MSCLPSTHCHISPKHAYFIKSFITNVGAAHTLTHNNQTIKHLSIIKGFGTCGTSAAKATGTTSSARTWCTGSASRLQSVRVYTRVRVCSCGLLFLSFFDRLNRRACIHFPLRGRVWLTPFCLLRPFSSSHRALLHLTAGSPPNHLKG